MTFKNHTWSGTAVVANTCRNRGNSPMEVKTEVGHFEIFVLPLESLIRSARNYAESARSAGPKQLAELV